MEKEEWRKKIGEQIRQRRESLGMTQAELSERTGLDRANISKIEGGRYNVSVDLLGRIAGALKCEFQVRIAEERAKLEAERQEREQAERERREKAAAENVVALARIKA